MNKCMNKYKNLEEILELCKDELDDRNVEIHATLERKELIELRALKEENEHLRDLYLGAVLNQNEKKNNKEDEILTQEKLKESYRQLKKLGVICGENK